MNSAIDNPVSSVPKSSSSSPGRTPEPLASPTGDRLRITFVCPADGASGGARVISLYAARLAERGHKVRVVLPRAPGLNWREKVGAIRRDFKALGKRPKRMSFYQPGPYEVHRLAHAGPITDNDVPDADVVIATWWETAEWVWKLSPTKGAKLHFMQDYEVWGAPGGDVSRVDATCALPIPKIVIAPWVETLLSERFGQRPIAYVPNSVETDKFFAPPRGKQPTPTVGFTYMTMRNKGCDITIAAIERARQRIPDLKVVSFGMSPPDPRMPLPPGTQYHCAAPDHQLRELYRSCDAWLFGTRIEGFGLPILEAMACRTPVIGAPAGAAPDLIGHGGGILIGMEDAEGMADAIVRVAHMSDNEWRRLSDAAFRTATSYSWEEAADRFETAVVRVASDARP